MVTKSKELGEKLYFYQNSVGAVPGPWDCWLVPAILSSVKVFLFDESLGGVESLITFPAAQTHTDMDPDIRSRLGINERLLRLSVGVEAVEDLIDDLRQALDG